MQPEVLLGSHLVIFCLLLGISASFLTIDLMLCRITRLNYPTFRSWTVAALPVIGILLSYLELSFLTPAALLLVTFASLLVAYTLFLVSVIAQLANHLHIHVFRSEEHTSELQSLMRISYAAFCLKQKTY